MCSQDFLSGFASAKLVFLFPFLFEFVALAQPFTSGVIFRENQKPGTIDWRLTNPATQREIEGYASRTSVNRGESIDFLVNTASSNYTLEVFRLGWYGGAGARKVFGPVTAPGSLQYVPSWDPTTGFVECAWTNPFTLNIPATPDDPTDWASGAYLARLTTSPDGKQAYMIFGVRDDNRPSDLLVQMSFDTYEAYNDWGGKSLYGFNSWYLQPAIKVSFNRPFAMNQLRDAVYAGAGEFFSIYSHSLAAGFECNLVRWLEREGYDVSYCTSLDTHTTANLLWSHKAFISMGHDEYWSYPMRWNVQAARDRGVNLAFFGANACYWQVRFEPSTIDGTPNRTMVCYKSTKDPVFKTSSNIFTTVNFRDSPVSDPEASLIGIQYTGFPIEGDLVIRNPSHWIFAGTGLPLGRHLPGLLGIEIDDQFPSSPANLSVACISPFILGQPGGPPGAAEVASYTAASGATVFATGTLQWSWGLDDFNQDILGQSWQNPAVQQMTRNVLARLCNLPAPSPDFFFRTDSTTAGTWKPHYGFDGFVLPNDSTNIPAYATVNSFGAASPLLLSASLDPNSLQRSAGTNRYLSAWSSPTNFTLDLNFSDSSNHLVAFYFWDWNNAGRTQLVQVFDPVSSNLLDRRVIAGFTNGQWWVWQLKGHVLLNISNVSGPGCLASAITFGNGTAAQFLGVDSLTQGNWKPLYGTGGAVVFGDSQRNPSYGVLKTASGNLTTWTWGTSDPRALQRSATSEGVLAAWKSETAFSLLLNFTDNAWHQVALYCVDPEPLGRSQRVSVIEPFNNSVLDTRELTSFSTGQYLIWNIRGAAKIELQRFGADSAVVSGIFFDPSNRPPAIHLTSPNDKQEFPLPARVLFAANASDLDGSIRQVDFYANGVRLATVTNAPFTFNWTNGLLGQYTVTAVATDDRRAQTVSDPVTIQLVTPAGYQPPAVAIAFPTNGAIFQAPATLNLSASVTAPSAPLLGLQFLLDGAALGPLLTNQPFTLTVSNLNIGSHTIGATIQDVFGVTAPAPINPITILPVAVAAQFRGVEIGIQGSWEGLLGSDGFLLPACLTNLPRYALVTPFGCFSGMFESNNTDPRVLELPGSVDRCGGAWFTNSSFSIDLNLIDGNTHRVALYFVDWIWFGGSETVQLSDPSTGTILDSRTVSDFHLGTYLLWDITGNVKFNFSRSAQNGPTLLSGLFFGPPLAAPRVSLVAPSSGSTLVAPEFISLSAFVMSSASNIEYVEFLANGRPLGIAFSGPAYDFVWSDALPGSYTLLAQAVDSSGAAVFSVPVSITIQSVQSAALFVGLDSSRQGNWLGVVGSQGHVIAGDSANLPSNLSLNLTSQLYVWSTTTTDPRALQRASGSSRVAAAWYSFTNLTVDLNSNDTLFHRVSLYCLDWPLLGASQSLDVFDAVSGKALDHRSLSAFANGATFTWDVQGHVVFRLTGVGGSPAMLSGLFFDASSILPPLTLQSLGGSIAVAPTNVILSADAPSDPAITRVDFYVGNLLLGSASTGPPWQFTWTNPPPGTWSITAREISAFGSTNSVPILLEVVTNASIIPISLSATLLPDGTLELDMTFPVVNSVRLDTTSDLTDPASWTPLWTNRSAVHQVSLILDDPAIFAQRFYRLVIQP